jgi:DNA mismatch repair ATPase MutL
MKWKRSKKAQQEARAKETDSSDGHHHSNHHHHGSSSSNNHSKQNSKLRQQQQQQQQNNLSTASSDSSSNNGIHLNNNDFKNNNNHTTTPNNANTASSHNNNSSNSRGSSFAESPLKETKNDHFIGSTNISYNSSSGERLDSGGGGGGSIVSIPPASAPAAGLKGKIKCKNVKKMCKLFIFCLSVCLEEKHLFIVNCRICSGPFFFFFLPVESLFKRFCFLNGSLSDMISFVLLSFTFHPGRFC